MSELKPYIGPHPTDATLTEYYLKSEADKVIAELKAQKAQTEDDCAYWKAKAQRERYSNYRRCVAMARWCSAELGMLVSTWESKIKYYKRWQKRWLEIAEELKEAK